MGFDPDFFPQISLMLCSFRLDVGLFPANLTFCENLRDLREKNH